MARDLFLGTWHSKHMIHIISGVNHSLGMTYGNKNLQLCRREVNHTDNKRIAARN